MTEAQSKTLHRLTGLALVLIGVFVVISLVNIYSRSGSIDIGGTVRNTPPEEPTIYISDSANGRSNDYSLSSPVSLNAGTTKTFNINGTVQDLNGFRDITSVSVVLYEADASGGASCTPNKSNCYSASCSIESIDATTIGYNCAVPIYYNASASTKWMAEVTAIDAEDSKASNTAKFAIDSLLALDYTSSIDFGILTPREVASATFDAAQKGNVAAALRMAGSELRCDSGDTIDLSYLKYADSDVGFASANAIAASPTAVSGVSIARKASDVETPKGTVTIYMEVPEGISGVCSGTLEVSSISAE